jgi:Phosphotransferase enzyme family
MAADMLRASLQNDSLRRTDPNRNSPMRSAMPTRPEQITKRFIDDLVRELRPDVSVKEMNIVGYRGYGDADNEHSVSTSGQVRIAVRYGGKGHEGLPTQLLAKMSVPDDVVCANPEFRALLENEVNFYKRARNEMDIESPLGLGGRYEAATGRHFLLMEDISLKKPHINSMADADNPDMVARMMDCYAKLHARYWNSPRFKKDLSWLQGQVKGAMEDMFDGSIRTHVQNEIARERFKAEFVAEAGWSADDLYFGEKALKRHQAKLPQTFLHGDAHMGNTYYLPDGTGGIFDWQVTCRGYGLFDVGYYLHSSLSVGGRRMYERPLLKLYLERLRAHGVKDAPKMNEAWKEYRMVALHSYYLGWLTAPRENYGFEVTVIGNHRCKAAFMDLEAGKLIRELM